MARNEKRFGGKKRNQIAESPCVCLDRLLMLWLAIVFTIMSISEASDLGECYSCTFCSIKDEWTREAYSKMIGMLTRIDASTIKKAVKLRIAGKAEKIQCT